MLVALGLNVAGGEFVAGLCAFMFMWDCVLPFIVDAFGGDANDLALPSLVGTVDRLDCLSDIIESFPGVDAGIVLCLFEEWVDVACEPILASADPNEIVGPTGIDYERWVSAVTTLPYTIRFENDDSLATAPARVVRISHILDDDLNVSSFRLGDITFGSFFVDVPDNSCPASRPE